MDRRGGGRLRIFGVKCQYGAYYENIQNHFMRETLNQDYCTVHIWLRQHVVNGALRWGGKIYSSILDAGCLGGFVFS